MIRIGDSCSDPIEWFGLTEWEIRTTYTKADARSSVPIEGGKAIITICEKDHGAGRRLITIAHHHNGNEYISLAMPVPSVVPPHETPLETFVDLCERYGLPVIAGDAESKLLISATVPGPNPKFGGPRAKDHKGLICSMIKVNSNIE